jgi:hypothetical protein
MGRRLSQHVLADAGQINLMARKNTQQSCADDKRGFY